MTEWSKRPDQSVVDELMSYAARIPPSGSFSATASTGNPLGHELSENLNI